ncbi:MAG: MaoC family dehydratase [Actinobacteria bacterium]|nr:MaoC family dehydratase [Actinomycetota bacterium]
MTESRRSEVTEGDVRHFAEATGDFSAIHLDEDYARTTQFGTRIAHGALLVGYVSTVVGLINDHLPPPGGVSYRYDVAFRRPALFGDTITTRLSVRENVPERREILLDAECVNQRDEALLTGTVVMKVLRREA